MKSCETNGLAFDADRMWINVSYDLETKIWGISFDDVVGENDYYLEVEESVRGDDFIIYSSHEQHFDLLEETDNISRIPPSETSLRVHFLCRSNK